MKLTVKSIKDKAWDYCSKYIRLKYSDKNGFVRCYTCSAIKFWKEMQAGHGIQGRTGNILFEERIIRPQCAPCNVWKYGNLDVFHAKLIKEFGPKFLEEMLKLKNRPKKFTLKEIIQIRDKYKKLFEKELSKKDLLLRD